MFGLWMSSYAGAGSRSGGVLPGNNLHKVQLHSTAGLGVSNMKKVFPGACRCLLWMRSFNPDCDPIQYHMQGLGREVLLQVSVTKM